jgi:hypothetical protein
VARQTFYEVAPSAARLTESLRDIGYDFPTAVADVVDNSISANATRVEIEIAFAGEESSVSIADDGTGMTASGLLEALRYGSRRDYGHGDLGRYGLGLKTASLSQCRSVTVVTQRTSGQPRTTCRMLDLDLIAEWDRWAITEPLHDHHVTRAIEMVSSGGTVVLWRKLDRVLPEKRPDGGWARRRIENLISKTKEHLGIVFHRFLTGEAGNGLVISINGEKVRPWDPFAPDEPKRQVLPMEQFEITVGDQSGVVTLRRYVLPSRDQFSSPAEFERLSGPLNWNRQQGIYIYRENRLVQWGGWNGIRGIDEHTKLARASVDFDADLDLAFNINVAKMRVAVPPPLRQMLERPINELCIRADEAYRKTPRGRVDAVTPEPMQRREPSVAPSSAWTGLALRAAAMEANEYAALQRIVDVLRRTAPDVLITLGLED